MKTSLLQKLNKPVFFISVAIYTALFLCIGIFTDGASTVINGVLNFTLHNLGWVYIVGYAFVFIISMILAFGRFGRERLGGKDASPEYSFFSWVAMLFCAGLGVGLVFFGVSEPVSHYLCSPAAADGSRAAALEAMRITMFHWTILPWAGYSIVGLAVGYYAYKYNLPCVISTALYPVFGEKGIKGAPGKIVDTFSLIAMVCGISMSLGFAAVQSMTGIGYEFGFSPDFKIYVLAAVGIGACALCSALSGLQNGVRLLSDFNTYVVYLILLFVLIAGPTVEIIKIILESIGVFIYQFPLAMFHVDGFGVVAEKVGFEWVESWTVFYWAWWIAFAPFVGTFLAKISKGRTVREFIVACILMPAIMCALWFGALGGGAIQLDLTTNPGLAEAINVSAETSLFVLLDALPLSKIMIVISVVLIITLIITSMDSATYMSTVVSCKTDEKLPYSLRVFWAVYIILNAVLMIYLGGLELLKYTAVVLAFPFMLVIIVMTWGLFRDAYPDKTKIIGHKKEDVAKKSFIYSIRKRFNS